jgi:hypothetical protein
MNSLTLLFWSIALLIAMSGVVTGLSRYATNRYRHILYASLGLASQMAYLLFTLLAQVYVDPGFFYIAIYANTPMGLFAILLVDSISSDHLDLKKMTVYITFVVSVLIYSLEPGTVYIDNTVPEVPAIRVSEKFSIILYLYTLVMNLLYMLYNTNIHVNAPKNLKRYTWVYFGSTVLYSIVSPVIVAIFYSELALNNYLIPSIGYILGATGGSITVIILVMQPQLAYILPFKVGRLTVFETTSGKMIFNHTWRSKDEVIKEELFSSILQGIGLLMEEAVKKGSLTELVVTKAHIILKRSNNLPVAFILVASKTSKSLRAALDNFAEKFTAKYEAFISGDGHAAREVSNFQDAGVLVEACFPFLPEYS